eukprot:COSAG02_NODE_2198_length_9544_cov_30.739121_5_plen_93_part_00
MLTSRPTEDLVGTWVLCCTVCTQLLVHTAGATSVTRVDGYESVQDHIFSGDKMWEIVFSPLNYGGVLILYDVLVHMCVLNEIASGKSVLGEF